MIINRAESLEFIELNITLQVHDKMHENARMCCLPPRLCFPEVPRLVPRCSPQWKGDERAYASVIAWISLSRRGTLDIVATSPLILSFSAVVMGRDQGGCSLLQPTKVQPL